jgi:SAM-dependent methyltransferase
MVSLNVGSGSNRRQDYISVDLYDDAADEHWDIGKRWVYSDETVDNIYACHVIEHLSREEFKVFTEEAKRVLKRGGQLEIRCPDIEKVCKLIIADPYILLNHQRLYGLQINDGEYHKSGYNNILLQEAFHPFKSEILSPSSDYELHMRFTK